MTISTHHPLPEKTQVRENFCQHFKAGILCGACMLAAIQYAVSELNKLPNAPPLFPVHDNTAAAGRDQQTPGTPLRPSLTVVDDDRPRSPDINDPLIPSDEFIPPAPPMPDLGK